LFARFMRFVESSMNFLWRLMRLRSLSKWRRPQGSLLRAHNHPLKSASERSRDQDLRRERGNRRHEDGWSATRAGDAYAAGSRAEASFAFEFEEWKLRGFTDSERDVWVASGLRTSQAKTAASLREAGLLPVDLGADLSGWTVLERLQKGEGAQAVARLLQTSRKSDAS
jgi:hypothetical protein